MFGYTGFSTLADTAIPVEGIYQPYIGTVQFFEQYQVKVMLQDASFDYLNKGKTTTYLFRKGYVMLKPLVDQFVLERPNSEVKLLK